MRSAANQGLVMIVLQCRTRNAFRQSVPLAIAVGLACLNPVAVPAGQDYPARVVRIVVPYPAGGTADLLPRIVGDRLARKWGQPVTIENRTGGGGNIGADVAAKAEPDGYTLLASPPGPLVVNQSLYQKLTFEPAEFVPVTVMARVPNALIVNPNRIVAKDVVEFIAYAREHPGKITVANQGIGTTSHLTSALFQQAAATRFVDVPYRGSAPALQGLIAGDVDAMFDNLGISLPLAKAGTLRLLAVGTEQRLASLPDVATIAQTLPGFASTTWFALVAPPRTPQWIVDILNADIVETLRSPEVVARFAELSAQPGGESVQATAAYLREEADRWHRVIKTAGIKVE
jgi:tripartite-type tricarboxylate transporter receptor subunit TctC